MYRMTNRRLTGYLLVLVLCASSIGAQPLPLLPPKPKDEQPVSLLTVWSLDRAHAGDSAVLAVVLDIAAGYHLIADAAQLSEISGFKPVPTRIRMVAASSGIVAESPRYPPAKPLKADFAEGSIASFEGRTIVYVPVRIDADVPVGTASIQMEVQYQACSESACLMPRREVLEAGLDVIPAAEGSTRIHTELFEGFHRSESAVVGQEVRLDFFGMGFTLDASSRWGWIILLLAAFCGGFLLNLTPCVLPLVPIKIISMSRAAANRGHCLALGLSTFGGVVAFWVGLGAVASMISGFTSTNQLFQYPVFTIAIGVLIAAMAITMLAGYSARLPGFLYALNPGQETAHGAFGIGVLTAVLSTPCTAPFMGAAVAWAVTQAPIAAVSTFLAIGAGMGLPYLVLSAVPRLLGAIPKTGPASLLLKQTLGMFMLAAAAYFIGVGLNGWLTDSNAAQRYYWWPVMAVCAAAGAWMGCRAFMLSSSTIGKAICLSAGAFIMASALIGGLKLTSAGPIAWVPYTPERLVSAFKDQKTVLLIFTAEWCLNCKALEQSVWSDPQLVESASLPTIMPMKVDLTGSNPDGRAKLREAGSLTIPLIVVYAANGRPVFKSDFYTAGQIKEAMKAAQGG